MCTLYASNSGIICHLFILPFAVHVMIGWFCLCHRAMAEYDANRLLLLSILASPRLYPIVNICIFCAIYGRLAAHRVSCVQTQSHLFTPNLSHESIWMWLIFALHLSILFIFHSVFAPLLILSFSVLTVAFLILRITEYACFFSLWKFYWGTHWLMCAKREEYFNFFVHFVQLLLL